jgi:hypothetical protein
MSAAETLLLLSVQMFEKRDPDSALVSDGTDAQKEI